LREGLADMRNVLLLERSEAGEAVGVVATLAELGERRVDGAVRCAIGVVGNCERTVGFRESPERAGLPLSQDVRMFEP
jgi:hypothetical protein